MQNTTESMLDEAVVHVYYADITVQNTDSQEILVLFTKYLYTTVVCVSLIGLALNWLCYRSALFLPNANSSLTPILIRLLAFWDSMALGYNLIDHGIMRLIGWGYSSKHVSTDFKIIWKNSDLDIKLLDYFIVFRRRPVNEYENYDNS